MQSKRLLGAQESGVTWAGNKGLRPRVDSTDALPVSGLVGSCVSAWL